MSAARATGNSRSGIPGNWREIPAGNCREFPENSIIFNFYQCVLIIYSSCIFYFRQPILNNKIAVPDSDIIFRVHFSIFSDTTPPEVQNKKSGRLTILWRQICVNFDNLIGTHCINNDLEAQLVKQPISE